MIKHILILVILFCTGYSFSQTKKEDNKKEPEKIKVKKDEPPKEEEVFTMVEEMPEFPGGQTEMMKFVRDNLKFPESAKNDTTFRGCKTLIKFVIGSDGIIKNETVVRNCINCAECDMAAIKVISSMPKWKPGKQNGKAVAVNYALPIFFNIH